MVLSTVISARFWAEGVKLVITIAVGGPGEFGGPGECFVAGIRNEGRWRDWRGSWHVHGDWVYVDIGGRTFRKRRGTLKLHRTFFWWYRQQLEDGVAEPWRVAEQEEQQDQQAPEWTIVGEHQEQQETSWISLD